MIVNRKDGGLEGVIYRPWIFTIYGAFGGDPEILKNWVGGQKTMLSAPSPFIRNTQNEMYVICTGLGGLLKKNSKPI